MDVFIYLFFMTVVGMMIMVMSKSDYFNGS